MNNNQYISNDAARQSATGLTLLFCVFCGLFVCLFACLFVCLFSCLFVVCCLFVCLFVCLFGSRAPNVRHCALHVQLHSARVLFFRFACFCVLIAFMTEVCVIAAPF